MKGLKVVLLTLMVMAVCMVVLSQTAYAAEQKAEFKVPGIV